MLRSKAASDSTGWHEHHGSRRQRTAHNNQLHALLQFAVRRKKGTSGEVQAMENHSR